MNVGQLDGILSPAIALCAVMALINIALIRRRGPAAIVMSCAFVTLGFTTWMYKIHVAQGWIGAGALVTALLLGLDFGLRASRLPKQGPRP